ncbi:MAG: sulfurtransferase [Chloroflexi bacterium]|nr:sulfurtransferase [Chloroflexota bacterium]
MNRHNIIIEAEELLTRVNEENIRIFDASIVDDMYQQGHIPGATYFDHEKFSDPGKAYEYMLLPDDKLAAQIGAAGISNDTEVVVYACGMLPYAARAWWVLRYAGHNNVRVLNGGLSAWKKAGGEVEQVARQYEPVVFHPEFKAGMFANKEEVIEALKDKEISVVDVLPLESYEGAHIPGSTCLSSMDLMQGLDYLLPDDQLALRLQEKSGYKRIITYCGGGIAAAVNAMAHLIVGQENVAVYDGSLFEWIGEGLPVRGTGKWEIWKQSA